MTLEKSDYIIDVRGISKSFNGKKVVNNIDLKIKSGEIFAFIGPNGSGKTTTIRMLCGLITPDTGEGHCLGYNIRTETRGIKAHTGYMPQYFSLYKDLTIYENLNLIGQLYGIPDRQQRIAQAMETVGLTSRQKQLAGSLSGGWKQRLTLATALLHDAYFLLLDEPTASVDPEARKHIWNILHDLSERGTTILLTSHNMDEIEHCHRIAYINLGDLMICGTLKEIIEQTKLMVWSVTGPNLPLLAKQLENKPGIEQLIAFYDHLHIIGREADALQAAIKPFQTSKHYHWEIVPTTLEDVVIWLGTQRGKKL